MLSHLKFLKEAKTSNVESEEPEAKAAQSPREKKSARGEKKEESKKVVEANSNSEPRQQALLLAALSRVKAFLETSKDIQKICKSEFIHNLFTIHSQYTHNTLTIHSQFTHNTLIVPLAAHIELLQHAFSHGLWDEFHFLKK